jgi:hypothetical protein
VRAEPRGFSPGGSRAGALAKAGRRRHTDDRSPSGSVKYSVALPSGIEVIVMSHDDSKPANHR